MHKKPSQSAGMQSSPLHFHPKWTTAASTAASVAVAVAASASCDERFRLPSVQRENHTPKETSNFGPKIAPLPLSLSMCLHALNRLAKVAATQADEAEREKERRRQHHRLSEADRRWTA